MGLKAALKWMDLTLEKRNLGMSLVLVILSKFGEDKVPEWEVQDQQLLKQMQNLTNFKVQEKSFKESSTKILDAWSTLQAPKPEEIKPKVDQNKKTEGTATKIESENIDGDLDSDDDDFPAYDMSNDTKVGPKKDKKILYLREVIEELTNPDSDYIEDCFGLLPDLCRRHLKHEDKKLVQELTKAMLYSQNRFDSKDFTVMRQ